MTEFKYLFFNTPKLGQAILSRTVCVKNCPTGVSQPISCFVTGNTTSCDNLQSYDTKLFAGGFCLPTEKEVLAKLSSLFTGINLESCVESISVNRWVIFGSIILAFALSYLASVFLQHCAWCVVVVAMAGVFGLGGFLSFASWGRYKTLKSEAESGAGTESGLSNADFYKWVAVGLWASLALLLLATVCLFGRIKLAVSVIQAAAEFVSDQTAVVLVPIFMVALNVVFLAYWLWGLAAVFSTGEIYHNYDFPWGKIKYSEPLKKKLMVHGFQLLWVLAFLLGVSHFVLAGSTAIWYFNRNDRDMPRPIAQSVAWLLRYHVGSVALGSLLLAILWLLRLIAKYLEEGMRNDPNNNKLADFALKCVGCCLACLDKFLQFFNKHVYIEMALKGTNYCTSASAGSKVVARNLLRFGVLHGLGEIIMNFVVIFIALVGTYCAYIGIRIFSPQTQDMHGTAAVLLVVALVMLCISKLFAHIWEVSSDSILHCHCIDECLEGGDAKNSTATLNNALARAENKATNGYM